MELLLFTSIDKTTTYDRITGGKKAEKHIEYYRVFFCNYYKHVFYTNVMINYD